MKDEGVGAQATVVKCPNCGNGTLSFSTTRSETFWDENDPDEKYWTVHIKTGHCWICDETQVFKVKEGI